jgi:hypothetical protein
MCTQAGRGWSVRMRARLALPARRYGNRDPKIDIENVLVYGARGHIARVIYIGEPY